jgi:hypothetical protein
VLSSVLGKPSLFVEEEINGGRIRSVFQVMDEFG